MNANELLAYNQGYNAGLKAGIDLNTEPMLRQQQNEIEELKNANRFIQNFAEEQHQRAVALESELDWAVELYTDKAIENEALKELLANEGIVVGHDYLNNCIATMRKAQEK